MQESYKKVLQDIKQQEMKTGTEVKMRMSLSFIQNLFEMQDVNKWLRFNATNERQLEHVKKSEDLMQTLLKKLYVPDYQSVNV